MIFWLAIAYGLAVGFRERPTLTATWLLVPVSACLFAILRLVPLTDRLAVWILPALYGAIAFAADDSFHRAREWMNGRKLSALALGSAVGISLWLLLTDMAQRTRDNLFLSSADNHGFNDHAALRFLLVQRQAGDVLVTTHLGLPAVWWYAGIPIGNPYRGRRHPEDESPILELRHEGPLSPACRMIRQQTHLQRALGDARRAAIHLGFDSNIPVRISRIDSGQLHRVLTSRQFQIGCNGGRRCDFRFDVAARPIGDCRHPGLVATTQSRPSACGLRRREGCGALVVEPSPNNGV